MSDCRHFLCPSAFRLRSNARSCMPLGYGLAGTIQKWTYMIGRILSCRRRESFLHGFESIMESPKHAFYLRAVEWLRSALEEFLQLAHERCRLVAGFAEALFRCRT